MVKYHLETAWSPATTTDYERQFTENRHIPTDYKTRGQFNNSHNSTSCTVQVKVSFSDTEKIATLVKVFSSEARRRRPLASRGL